MTNAFQFSRCQIRPIAALPTTNLLNDATVPDAPDTINDCQIPTISPLPPETTCPAIGGTASVIVEDSLLVPALALTITKSPSGCAFDFDFTLELPNYCPALAMSKTEQHVISPPLVGITPLVYLTIVQHAESCAFDFNFEFQLPGCPALAMARTEQTVNVIENLDPPTVYLTIVQHPDACAFDFNFEFNLPGCPHITTTTPSQMVTVTPAPTPQVYLYITQVSEQCAFNFDFEFYLPGCVTLTPASRPPRPTFPPFVFHPSQPPYSQVWFQQTPDTCQYNAKVFTNPIMPIPVITTAVATSCTVEIAIWEEFSTVIGDDDEEQVEEDEVEEDEASTEEDETDDTEDETEEATLTAFIWFSQPCCLPLPIDTKGWAINLPELGWYLIAVDRPTTIPFKILSTGGGEGSSETDTWNVAMLIDGGETDYTVEVVDAFNQWPCAKEGYYGYMICDGYGWVVIDCQTPAKWLRFTLADDLADTDATTTGDVTAYYDGADPGATVTLVNGDGFIGSAGYSGTALLMSTSNEEDEHRCQYEITQLSCNAPPEE